METYEAALPYLAGSAIVLLSSLLWVTAILDIRSQMRRGTFSRTTLAVMVVTISVLTVCLVIAADVVLIDNRSGALSPWSEWGFRLGS